MNETASRGVDPMNFPVPVLLTGIRCVASATREILLPDNESSHRADARWLDSCDKHRNEGDVGVKPIDIRLIETMETVQ
jgi:hypothetical protein